MSPSHTYLYDLWSFIPWPRREEILRRYAHDYGFPQDIDLYNLTRDRDLYELKFPTPAVTYTLNRLMEHLTPRERAEAEKQMPKGDLNTLLSRVLDDLAKIKQRLNIE